MSEPHLSLVVATKGRATPFQALFESLEAQTCRDFEVVVVDQNPDARVGTPETEGWSFPIRHLRTPSETGASRARNAGFAVARGVRILFPDDDCWYPPNFLAHALERMQALNADVLAGRAADPVTGRDINGRFEQVVTRIDRDNVWTTGIEWVVLFDRKVLQAVGGYDVGIGVGASTPWQSCEAQDIVLRALDKGFSCVFDPSVFGHHAELDIRDASMLRKGRAYARGLGHVLRVHKYPTRAAASWVLRPTARAMLALARGDVTLFSYYRSVALGRLEGWRGRVPAQKPASPVKQAAPARG
ncbi:hypothetical protein RHAL1_02293 [Beijerinckiaceae bacterium RH AL1]|nr:glycosyltransferase [Beijerinckiaceae bacterium]VVB46441.1 hypothetical protein RHCH11_RHCH11_02248 [Beijerinckiaceae bacterium RH CH11]VVB46526.1 hypothetical protein RHAL8_02244 [Beijerinckiaceae bacterium RH AL8]VVC55376.1 hypothetical protein RHAL1_02293 [Beijerinckiaceae bacterium RH AL1]